MPQNRCKCCGAYLDFGERCDCGGTAPAVPQAAPIRRAKPKRRKTPIPKFNPKRAWEAFDYK